MDPGPGAQALQVPHRSRDREREDPFHLEGEVALKEERPRLSVLVLNLNGRDVLAECLASVEASTCRSCEILVLDNGSTDGSVAYVQTHFPGVRLLAFEQNLGYAGANNRGIRAAAGEYVLLLNNDTLVDPSALSELVAFLDAAPAHVGGCMPKLLFHDRPELVNSVGVAITPQGNPSSPGRAELDRGHDEVREIFCPHGAAALYRRTLLADVGLFDEDFFIFQEEVDLGWRARLRGWRFFLVPQARVRHREQVTMKRIFLSTLYLLERNRIWLLVKNAGLSTLLAMIPELLRYEVDCLRDVWWKKELTRIRARVDALRGLGRMLAKRRRIQRARRVAEGEIRRWIGRGA